MVKVIFLENLEENKVGDIKNVADGYARNYLVPKGIVEIATEGKVRELESKMAKLKKEEAEKVAAAEKIAGKITKEKIVIEEEVNEDGHLYGAVTPKEVAEVLADRGYEIDGSDIIMEESIKEPGDYEVEVRVGHGVETKLKVVVQRKE
ncbi:MAG: 50S ribosomal protein L9 [Patescibacteria group bacterium]|nr:50S ribosomal protein L9 [Patescibacteria group bacterium]